MKVTLFTNDLGRGGSERNLVNLANGLSRYCEVDMLTLRREAPLCSELDANVPHRLLGSSNHYLAFPLLVSYLARVRPNVLVCKLRRPCVMGLIAGRLTRTPVVVVLDTVFDRRAARREAMEVLLDRIAPWLYRWAMTVVVANEGMRILASEHDLTRLCCVPNALDLERIESWSREPLTAPENYLLWAGRLTPEKDPLLALRAFSKLTTDHHLVLLGDGELAAECRLETRRLGIENRVLTPGWAPNPYPWIAAAKAVFLTSHYEGSPNVLLEAMALGITVVSVDCPASPAELLHNEHLGYLSKSRDPKRLAEKLEIALHHPIPRERLQQHACGFCRQHAAETFYREVLFPLEPGSRPKIGTSFSNG
ncbi:MAG: glycosyltransferase [Candidatus Eremiobacteraeota bacterium]|nr:glycosyltransferase [Candidatus Eremiobacteraeota bacterium]